MSVTRRTFLSGRSDSMTLFATGLLLLAVFLAGKDARINIEQEPRVELNGPRTVPLAGLFFHEDRKVLAADKTTVIELDPEGLPEPKEHRVRSDDARELVGTIYRSRNRLLVDGDKPVASEAAYTAIIAREFVWAESPEIVLNADYQISDVPVPEGVGTKAKRARGSFARRRTDQGRAM